MRLFNILERVEQVKTQYQKHYANDEDELERHGFFKKSTTRVTKHDDQSKEHHHQRANLDHCEVDAWWFDPCLLCWTFGHVPDDWRVSAGYHEKGRPGSHMKRVIAVQEEPSLHVNSTRERDVPDWMRTPWKLSAVWTYSRSSRLHVQECLVQSKGEWVYWLW